MTSIRPIRDGWDVPLDEALSGLAHSDERPWHPLGDEADDETTPIDPWILGQRVRIALEGLDLP